MHCMAGVSAAHSSYECNVPVIWSIIKLPDTKPCLGSPPFSAQTPGDGSALDPPAGPAAGFNRGRTSGQPRGKWKWSPETHRGGAQQEPGKQPRNLSVFPCVVCAFFFFVDVMAPIKLLVSSVLDWGGRERHWKSQWTHTEPHPYHKWGFFGGAFPEFFFLIGSPDSPKIVPFSLVCNILAASLTATVSLSPTLAPPCPENQVMLENGTGCGCPPGLVKGGDNCTCPVGFTLGAAAQCKGRKVQNQQQNQGFTTFSNIWEISLISLHFTRFGNSAKILVLRKSFVKGYPLSQL